MRRAFPCWLAVVAAALLCAPAAAGKRIVLPPAAFNAAQADVVVLATVTGFEDKPVKAPLGDGSGDEVEWTVAVLKIDKAIVGAKGLTHVKLGQTPSRGQVPLAKGQQVCLFLDAHAKANFHVLNYGSSGLDPKAPQFKQQLAEVEKVGAVLDKPADHLQAKAEQDRLFAASVLILNHRAPGQGRTKAKPIDAKESALILKALAEADWKNYAGDYHLSPAYAFAQLGVGPKDGWQPEPNVPLETSAHAWLKKNAATYRIQRYSRGDD